MATESRIVRPAERLRPSDVLLRVGWTLWGFSALATTAALQPIGVFLVGLVLIQLGVAAEWSEYLGLVAAGFGGYFLQRWLTAMERPVLAGHLSLAVIAVVALDFAINVAGAGLVAPLLLTALGLDWSPWLCGLVGGGLLTLGPELVLSGAVYERMKGY